MYLLVLTALFCVGAAALWAAVPKTAAGDYLITAAEPEDGGTAVKPVNINTAGVSELDGLPGIGPVLARRIIDWRTANGPFASPEQLLEVDGIGQATLDGLRDHITTEEIQE